MKIDYEEKLDFGDVLLKPKRSRLTSKLDVTPEREFTFPNSTCKWSGIPIMASNMDGVGTFSMARILQEYKMITILKKDYTFYNWEAARDGLTGAPVNLSYTGVCVGTGVYFDQDAEDFENLKKIILHCPEIPFIVVDVANAYLESSLGALKITREAFPDQIIVCGNVATIEMAEELILEGADIVKVGIGPGSVCTTRIKSGVGVPQLSAIIECSDVHGIGGHIIGDGGCTSPGDVAKAFGAGADFVMLGSMLAAHNVCEEKIVQDDDGKAWVEFYGMSSEAARTRHGGRKDGYRSMEGRVVRLPYRGNIQDTVEDLLGGLTSAMVYVGAAVIKDMPKCATFGRVRHTHSLWLKDFDMDRKYD